MRRLLTVVFCLLVVLPLPGQAQETSELTLPGQSDVRIIVDISGSMKESDPENLRRPAVRLLARLLPDGTTAGLWTFGQYVNMLVPHREVTDQWREQMVAGSEQINSVALRTNIGAAIDTASDTYYSDGTLENSHFIILTDGKVDVSDTASENASEERRILKELLPQLVDQGATLHPVALSEQADKEFLGQLASASGGHFQVAEDASELNRAFLTALNAAVPQEQIPLEGNRFTVDQGVEEFTALVFWGAEETRETRALSLIQPDGQPFELAEPAANMRWAREAGYDLMTVTEPMAGEWRINGELGDGSRVTVVSDLRMVVSPVPATFSEQDPIDLQIAFFEDGEKITKPEFLQVLAVSLSITAEDGRSGTKVLSGDSVPEDGVFSDEIGKLPAAGSYLIEVQADGKTFGRKFSAATTFEAPDAPDGLSASETAATETEEEFGAEPESIVEEVAKEAQPSAEAEVSPEPELESPIDVSQVEQPALAEETPVEAPSAESAPEDEPESVTSFPYWPIALGAVCVIALVVSVRAAQKKSAREQARAEAAAERETLEDLEEPEAQNQDAPVMDEESDVVEEVEVGESFEEAVEEDIPLATDSVQASDEQEGQDLSVEDEAEIPVADQVVADELEPDSDDLEEQFEAPVLESEEAASDLDGELEAEQSDYSGDEEKAQTEPEEVEPEEPEEVFGLEDFDLSEFDDVPELDTDSTPDDEGDSESAEPEKK